MKSLMSLATVLLCTALAFGQENYAQWSYYRNVAVNTKATGANVTADVANFPLLVRLGAADSAVFANAGTGGRSIRFAKANGTHLPYQIDSWDSAARMASVWVLVDTVKASDSSATLRLYWGRAGAVDSSNGNAVFSNGFTNAWHLGADSTAARPNAISTGNSAVPLNFPAGYKGKPGVIGKADSLRGGWAGTNPNGSNHPNVDQFDLGATNTNYSNGFTFSIWVLPTKQGVNVDYYVAADTDISGVIIAGTSTSRGAKFRQRNGNSGGNVGIINTSSAELDGLNTWRHVVYTKAAGTGVMTVYRDGASVATATGITAFASQARAFGRLGVPPAQAAYADSAFAGLMDEARIANVGRSAEWAKLEFETQKLTANAVKLDTIVSNQTVPGAPTGVTGVAGNTEVTVSWTAPALDGNSPIASYTATAVENNTKSCTTPNATTLNCVVTGLTNGTPYTFTVTAVNGIGTSAASAPSGAITPTASAVAPGAPVSPVAVAGNASAAVSWIAPAANGGSAITSYQARAVSDTAKTCTTANGTTLTCTVSGLANGTSYTFEVRAVNAVGAGPYSAPSNAVVPNAPPVIAYATPKTFTIGVSDSLNPLSTGGPVTSYSINAAAPAGLTFNTTTGRLGGTPTAATATTVYAIIATGPGGADTASVSITVRIPLPVIAYTPTVVTDSTTVQANHVPSTLTGTVASCTVNPTLPAGLAIAPTTCVISGTPTAASAATNYTIIATNSSGSDTATLNITVVIKPVSLRGAYVFRVSGAEKPYSFQVAAGDVEATEKVTLSIHDAYGRTVWTRALIPTAANRVIAWNGRTSKGLRASAGMYILRVKVSGKDGSTTASERAVSLKP